MCIAIYKPADKNLSKELLETCWDANPDGAGFMYTHNGNLRIKKGFMTFEKFFASFNNLQHKTAILHFRIKTHGKANEENTHPFFIADDMAFVHNGIINKVSTSSNHDMSDTWHFNEQILKSLYKLSPAFVDNEAVQELIKEYIGYSKLVFMDNKDNVWIMNEQKGEWDDGIWYSNGSYKPKVYSPPVVYGSGSYKPRYNKHNKFSDVKNLAINSIVQIRDDYLKTKKGAQGVVETFYQ
ncbi:MAG: class II glutamine amidotransferase, partial [Thaumarchaeota archaeon]|nr:class II glutamine amidotransferase [Nitrososphaerota archaeon]